MKDKIISADDIKPDYKQVKAVWQKMLNPYFDKHGNLIKDYVINVKCPFCDSMDFKEEFKINSFNHVTCDDCDTVYVTPRLKDKYVDLLYSDQYYSELYIKSMIPAFEKRKRLIGEKKFNQVKEFSKSSGIVLDIGCGVGEVISVFREKNWDCHAIEVNPGAIAWLKERGINVSDIHFNEYPEDVKFDVIMAWGVIEHVTDPNSFLKKAFRMLKPGGLFVSEVPHGNSLLVDYTRLTNKDPERIVMGEQHIVLYSLKAYKELHEKAGLKNLHVQTNGLDVSTIFNLDGGKFDEKTLFNMQELIDKKLYGDLLRGFWTK